MLVQNFGDRNVIINSTVVENIIKCYPIKEMLGGIPSDSIAFGLCVCKEGIVCKAGNDRSSETIALRLAPYVRLHVIRMSVEAVRRVSNEPLFFVPPSIVDCVRVWSSSIVCAV